MPDCDAYIIHLPRHLEDVHHWAPDKARDAVHVYGLRKPHASSKSKDECISYKECPVDNCSRKVKQLSSHLMTYHHLDAKSGFYQAMLTLGRKRRRVQSVDEFNDGDESCDDLFVDNVIENVIAPQEIVSQNPLLIPPQPDEPNNKLPIDFLGFSTWLKTRDGGRKIAADQHASQVATIFNIIDESKLNVSSLWSQPLIEIFTENYAVKKGLQPATIKAYLQSLKHWYTYILSQEADRLSPATALHIANMKTRVGNWISSYKGEAALRKFENMETDLLRLITPDKVKTFDASDFSREAIKSLGHFADCSGSELSMTDYTAIRNFLLAHIIITNACRSGALAHMTVEQYQNALEVDGNMVISVKAQKTNKSLGYAPIVLSLALYGWLTVFVTKVRIKISKMASTNNLFLSWNGEKMTGGDVTTALQAAWTKAGLGSNITATLMRKSAVSVVHQLCPEQKTNLADLMCHSTQTASRNYRCVERKKTSVAASKTLNNLMRNEVHGNAPNVPSAALGAEPKAAVGTFGAEQLQSVRPTDGDLHLEMQPESLLDRVNRSVSTAIDDLVDNASDVVGPSLKSVVSSLFNDEEAATIALACRDMIKEGKISEKRIAERLEIAGQKGISVLQNFELCQIVSRVKYERRKRRSSVPKFVISKPE